MNLLMESNTYQREQNSYIIKIKLGNKSENIGSGPIHLPTQELHTTGTWYAFDSPEWDNDKLSDAMIGIAYAMQSFIPVFVSCDRSDVHVTPKIKAEHTEKPTFFIHDSYPGGIGLSENIYKKWDKLLVNVLEHVSNCKCPNGCPICVGAQNTDNDVKENAERLLRKLVQVEG